MIIKIARVKKCLSLEQLAEKTGISRITLSKYEKGDCDSMTLKNLKKLVNALNLTPEEIVELVNRIDL
ncbi:MAG: helix-turn-helix transcriptional regulator [Peptostreptococcaceae bacterium]|nr:helix-turn-helix transcriptional regulator [Peptostreptococcaceae bacterium]MBP3932022.1 helix-turn-helix transcriptional regulator [Peptostreptococcaceae bacterium]